VDVVAEVPGNGQPITITTTGFHTYVLINRPVLKPDQGWVLSFTGSAAFGDSYDLFKALNVSGSTVEIDPSRPVQSNYGDLFVLSPCRPEIRPWLNVTQWVMRIFEEQTLDATLQVNTIDLPTPQPINLNTPTTFDIKAVAAGHYVFTTPKDIASLYFFAQYWDGADVYWRISKIPCSLDVAYAGSAKTFFEREIPLETSTTYYLYVSPNNALDLKLTLSSLPVSPSCSVGCSEGGACYNGKCACKNGYSGDKCALYSCNGIDKSRLCSCNVSAEITKNTVISKVPKYYNFHKPSPINDDHGWFLLVPRSNFWAKFFFNKVGGSSPNYCPHEQQVIAFMSTSNDDFSDETTEFKVGIRPCSRDQALYKSVSEFVVKVEVESGQGNIHSNASIVDLPPLKTTPMTTGKSISGTFGAWTPILMQYDVPKGVSNITFTYAFSTLDMRAVYHTVDVMKSPCSFDEQTIDLQDSLSGTKAIAVAGGAPIYLLLSSGDDISESYKLVIN